MTAPYHTDAPASTMTSPTSVAVGARNALLCTCGVNPSNENSGISDPPTSQVRAGDPECAPRRVAFGDQACIGDSTPLHEYAAVFAGGPGDAVGSVGGSV